MLSRRELLIGAPFAAARAAGPVVFPAAAWERRPPAALSLDAGKLEDLSALLGGRGCVVKDGYLAAEWGAQDEVDDILSSAKPILSTLLFFAVQEGKIAGVDARLADFGWNLSAKDQPMTFRHLGAMTSGYARPEAPGAAWAYNDFAIQLYQKTLFDRVFREDPAAVAHAKGRLGALGLQDGLEFRASNRRIGASVRDFARIVWFWLHRGAWAGEQVLESSFFADYCRPQTSPNLPASADAETDDYLGIGSFGGGSKHFTEFGAGAYGFNWWFNRKGRLHPDVRMWPDAPEDLVVSIGARGNNTAFWASKRMLLVGLGADWGRLEGGDPASRMNRALALFGQAAR